VESQTLPVHDVVEPHEPIHLQSCVDGSKLIGGDLGYTKNLDVPNGRTPKQRMRKSFTSANIRLNGQTSEAY